MSGQDGSRGYLFQAIIATLDSLNKKDWATVSIEPNTDNDKIDIVWTENDQKDIVYQVKSSINNFEKADILQWLLDLVNDSKNAKEYRLVLIGNCSGPTKKFFNELVNNATEEIFEPKFFPLIPLIKRIIVEIRSFDLDTTESAINSKVHEFLSKEKLKLDYSTIELIAAGLKIQFLRFSTHGRKMTKHEFVSTLLNWVKFNYPSYLGKTENELELNFYLSNNLDFADTLEHNFVIPEIAEIDLIQKRVTNTILKAKEINEIKLHAPKNPTDVFKGFEAASRLAMSINKLSASNDIYSVVPNSEKSLIQELAKKHLNLDIDDSFFYMGNLRNPQFIISSPFLGSTTPNYNGTALELRKRSLYDDFSRELQDLNDLLTYWKKLTEYRIIPIVLKNNGSMLNESIDIQIHFPITISILDPSTFPIPERINTLKELNDSDGILSLVLKHNKDSKVKEYSSYPPIQSVYLPNFPFNESFEERKSNEIEKYKDNLIAIYDYDTFFDNVNKITVVCNIDTLKPNDTISLPCYFLTKNKEGFFIEYEINSKNLTTKIRGTLVVKEI